MTRGSPAVVIVPNAAEPNTPFGRAERRRVRHVEHLGAHLDRRCPPAAARAASARGRDCGNPARAPDCESSLPSVNCGAARERGGVEPAAHGPLVGREASDRRSGSAAACRIPRTRCCSSPASTAIGMPDCSVSTPVSVQSFTIAPSTRPRADAPVRADRKFPDGRRHEDVRDVAGRIVAFEPCG